MVQVWKDRRLVRRSTIHDATVVSTGRKDRRKQIWKKKKPYAVVQYNKFMKGVDRADQYLSYYSILRRTLKSSEKSGTVSAELCSLQGILCVQDTKYKQKSKVQELPA